jgi:hypothetical protein
MAQNLFTSNYAMTPLTSGGYTPVDWTKQSAASNATAKTPMPMPVPTPTPGMKPGGASYPVNFAPTPVITPAKGSRFAITTSPAPQNQSVGGGSVAGVADLTVRRPTGATGGGAAPQPTNANTSMATMTSSLNTMLDTSADDANARAAQFAEQQKLALNEQYKPVFDYLDQQAGMVSGEQAALADDSVMGTKEGQIYNLFNTETTGARDYADLAKRLYSDQYGKISSAEEQARERLRLEAEGNRQNVFSRTDERLSDIGQQTQAAGRSLNRRLGAAADSSANVLGQALLQREAIKQRGTTLGIQDETLSQIDLALQGGNVDIRQAYDNLRNEVDGKIANVDLIYQDVLNKAEVSKQQNLANLGNNLQAQLSEIQSQKANATSQQLAELNQIEQNLYASVEEMLRSIDAQKYQNIAAAEQWKLERTAALEDLASQYQMASQYSVSTPANPDWRTIEIPLVDANGQYVYNENGTLKMVPGTYDQNAGPDTAQPLAGYQMMGGAEEPEKQRRNLFSFLNDGVGLFK